MMEMSDYLGQIVVDNRTEGTTITIGAPTLTNADIADKSYPYVVEPPSGEQKIDFKLFTGIFNDASKDRIEIPVTLKKIVTGQRLTAQSKYSPLTETPIPVLSFSR